MSEEIKRYVEIDAASSLREHLDRTFMERTPDPVAYAAAAREWAGKRPHFAHYLTVIGFDIVKKRIPQMRLDPQWDLKVTDVPSYREEDDTQFQLARGVAAQCWCREKTSGTIMDPDLAEEFAKTLLVFGARISPDYHPIQPEPIGKKLERAIAGVELELRRKAMQIAPLVTSAGATAAFEIAAAMVQTLIPGGVDPIYTSDPSNKPIVIIESPYAGDVDRNLRYLRAAMRDSLLRGEAPYASHALYTQPGVLDDDDPAERRLGMDGAAPYRKRADWTAFYTDLGTSPGIEEGLALAEKHHPVVRRSIPDWDNG